MVRPVKLTFKPKSLEELRVSLGISKARARQIIEILRSNAPKVSSNGNSAKRGPAKKAATKRAQKSRK